MARNFMDRRKIQGERKKSNEGFKAQGLCQVETSDSTQILPAIFCRDQFTLWVGERKFSIYLGKKPLLFLPQRQMILFECVQHAKN